MKLIRVERAVKVYSNNKENAIITEYTVDYIDSNILRKIVNAPEDDKELYDGYELNKEQLDAISDYLPEKIEQDFKKYYYVLESTGIYE